MSLCVLSELTSHDVWPAGISMREPSQLGNGVWQNRQLFSSLQKVPKLLPGLLAQVSTQ